MHHNDFTKQEKHNTLVGITLRNHIPKEMPFNLNNPLNKAEGVA